MYDNAFIDKRINVIGRAQVLQSRLESRILTLTLRGRNQVEILGFRCPEVHILTARVALFT